MGWGMVKPSVVYVVEFENGVVKVGVTDRAATRLPVIIKEYGKEATREFVSEYVMKGEIAYQAESVFKERHRFSTVFKTEYFNLPFDQAVEEVKQILDEEKRKGLPLQVTVGILLDRELHSKIQRMAQDEKLPMSRLIPLMLEQYVKSSPVVGATRERQ